MAAPKIEKLPTPYNFTNKDNAGRIKYIVIHYVGALGGAEANCKYYASKYLGASAHYFEEDELVGTFISEMALIDEDGDVVAFSNFLAKGKDETEVTFTIEDNY